MSDLERNRKALDKSYLDASRPVDQRVGVLVSQMTLREKIAQTLHAAPPIPRLEVPAYNWWNECLHGVARAGKATVFPQAIGMAATFNGDLVFKIADAISDEARAKHHQAIKQGNRGQYFGLTYWTPNINIFRDPRWGRGQESYGEDPYLTSRMGVAFCRGLQGDDPDYLKLVATPKHYAVHSGPEALRHEFDAVVSPRDLRETYLPAFKACVREAGAYSVMGAYNRTNGEPCCGSKTLLQDILRDEWGFEGYVVSDCWAIADFHQTHKVTRSPAESAAMAVKNGCELNCGDMYHNLRQAVDVTNVGRRGGDEVVQLYVKDVEASVPVPLRQLQSFRRIHLDAGETKAVTFELTADQFSALDDDGQPFVEAGTFEISVGGGLPEDETSGAVSVMVEVE